MNEKPRTFTSAERIAIVAFCILAVLVAVPVGALVSGNFRHFYIPSEAMEPTLKVNDRLIARMGTPRSLGRGDIVLVRVRNTTYIKRIAALPGDTIELIDGRVVLNGRPVAQRRMGVDRPPAQSPMGDTAIRLAEQFPGEVEPHQIYDSGPSVADDFPPIRISNGHVFLLGDNRDNSADSRVSREDMGLGGAVPIADIRGRPWWYYGLVQGDGVKRSTPH